MQQLDLKSWEEFETEVGKIIDANMKIASAKKPMHIFPFLFRGHQDSTFQLATTLERTNAGNMSFKNYYELISSVQPQIETFTGKIWLLQEREDFIKRTKSPDGLIFQMWGMDAYRYMIYLRHHGFPSPLLDWSSSYNIAAYFAFRSPVKPASNVVSIYAFSEYSEGIKSGSSAHAKITGSGPYVRSHKRHFLQQGQYTICSAFDKELFFAHHEEVFSRGEKHQDVCYKFNIPWTERAKVLKKLDNYNLNAFSLFDSEESLLETMALRELTFKS